MSQDSGDAMKGKVTLGVPYVLVRPSGSRSTCTWLTAKHDSRVRLRCVCGSFLQSYHPRVRDSDVIQTCIPPFDPHILREVDITQENGVFLINSIEVLGGRTAYKDVS